MLVLSRKVGESFVIGHEDDPDAVRVFVVGIERGQVKLGIEAPRTIPIHRTELRDPQRRVVAPGGLDAQSTP